MKLNKKHWIALAAVAIALLGLIGAAYWVMTRGEGRVERLDLANEQNSQLADALLDKIYGHGSYDPKQRCWKQTSDYMYFCMKPVSLDRVETGESSKLYLLAGGDGSSESEDGVPGGADPRLGAFIFDGKTHEVLASGDVMPFSNHDFLAPADSRLLRLNVNGDMAWLVEGNDKGKGFPQLLAAHGKDVVSIAGQVFGVLPDEDGARYDYQMAAQPDARGFYPLTLKITGGKRAGSFRFRFDEKQWSYQCEGQACSDRYTEWSEDSSNEPDDEGDDQSASSSQPPADANAALFDDGNTLSDADLKEVLAALGVSYVIKDQDAWGFVTDKCRTPFRLRGTYGNGHEKDHDELWIQGGDACTSGSVGQSIWSFARDDAGHLRVSLGVPATKAIVVTDGDNSPEDNPRNDIRLSGNGFCESVWRWDGKQYQRLRNEAMQPGGCDHEPAAQQ
ncbi:hypothetical protein [Chromobacterium violaceum]|uniref:hypothetical protein n=1 Tax=Chromobacterium violaceum TaxID=536 RepID=UPI0006542C5E|nr:hypothetical protein [Chromobacterium violaceum]KMN48245.1 hypothetical protein VK93_16845 [Chromobacterium violaceum]KMN85943.1 hypothetical protein VL02_11825 [Chromobacterium violaceum]KMN88881.1 hypothetical protein VL04_18300 [Chromobacterium violaceum]KMO03950.1 hypothetical protein VL16_10845 [Chromobacterium violaceum]OQS10313.1 hypothetical protein B0T38_09330 [Chromobacterium violaceum]